MYNMTSVSIEKNENGLQILRKTETQVQATLKVDDEIVRGVYEACRNLIESLKNSEGKINGENSLLLSTLVKEIIELAEGFKPLKGSQKKELVVILIKDIFEVELGKLDLDDALKDIIMLAVDNSIEPAIDLAIYVAKGGIKLDRTKVKTSCLKIFPCLKLQ